MGRAVWKKGGKGQGEFLFPSHQERYIENVPAAAWEGFMAGLRDNQVREGGGGEGRVQRAMGDFFGQRPCVSQEYRGMVVWVRVEEDAQINTNELVGSG